MFQCAYNGTIEKDLSLLCLFLSQSIAYMKLMNEFSKFYSFFNVIIYSIYTTFLTLNLLHNKFLNLDISVIVLCL